MQDMKWIQGAGTSTSDEYKEHGSGTHLPPVPKMHFKRR